MSIINVNGVELEFDPLDIECMERFENALDKQVEREEQELTNDMKSSQQFRQECVIIGDFFNAIFGEGTDRKLFGDNVNYRLFTNVYAEFINAIEDAANKEAAEHNKLLDKYDSARAERS